MIAELVDAMRGRWPDAPIVLVEYAATLTVLRALLRKYNEAAGRLDDAALSHVNAETRLERLETAARAERLRLVEARWYGALSEAARLVALKRDRYVAWKARRAHDAELRGVPPPPPYVMPEERGDAFEPGPMCELTPDPSNFATISIRRDPHRITDEPRCVLEARATLRIWSRCFAMHART